MVTKKNFGTLAGNEEERERRRRGLPHQPQPSTLTSSIILTYATQTTNHKPQTTNHKPQTTYHNHNTIERNSHTFYYFITSARESKK